MVAEPTSKQQSAELHDGTLGRMIVHRMVMARSQKFHSGTFDADAAFSTEFHRGTLGRMIVRRRVMARSQKFHGGTLDADAAFSPEFHDGTHGRMIVRRRVMRVLKSSTVELLMRSRLLD